MPRNGPAVIRNCKVHGPMLFHLYRARKGYVYRCKRCVGESVTRSHRKARARLVAEAGGCCVLCGYDRCARNLHFHHVNPEEKSFMVNMGTGKSLAAYREEAAKCVLLCANCHGEVEAGLVACPPLVPDRSCENGRPAPMV